MSSVSVPFELSLQGRSLPSPTGESSQTVDWIPDYLGYSWVAYGSFSSFVISLAPVPTRKDEADLGICHIIDVLHDPITCVRWEPTSSGFMAVSKGGLVCIYGPEFSIESNISVFPRRWSLQCSLEHTFQVSSFSWTESGDGILSVGTEVVMWKKNEEEWCQLWKSYVTYPQCIVAASFSARGLAATADGDSSRHNRFCVDNHTIPRKGSATVWWWEDSVGLLETELIHPQEVLMLQWRPSKPKALQNSFREILLTACNDGAVRLWLEIDNGRGRLEKAHGKDVPLKHLKPAYFVGAVIETKQCLHGILGKDVVVRWPMYPRRENLSSDVNSISRKENNSVVNSILKKDNLGSCEWLVGLGPEGSLCIWCVLYIDDINPSRCPRIFLWKQSAGVLSASLSKEINVDRVSMKVIAQRLGSKLADPPSCLDLLYMAHPLLSFHWFRVWLPVNSINGIDSKELFGSKMITTTDVMNTDAWGVVAEQFHSDGHSDTIISLAVHPIFHLGLIATLDCQGHIFLWKSRTTYNTNNMSAASCFLRWKPSGQCIGPSNSKMVTWFPALFSKNRSIFLLLHGGIIDCWLVSETTSKTGLSLLCSLLHRVEVYVGFPQQELCEIQVIPMRNDHVSTNATVNFAVIGLERTDSEVVCCDIGIILEGFDHHADNAGFEDVTTSQIVAHSFGIIKIKQPEIVSCLATLPPFFLPSVDGCSNCLKFESLVGPRPYDFATGSIDGVVRLWKKVDHKRHPSSRVENADNDWTCVGILKLILEPITMISIGSFGLKIAISGLMFGAYEINIWDLESYADISSFNLSCKVSLDDRPHSIQWLQVGNGQSFLGVLSESDLHIYSETKERKAHTDRKYLSQMPWFLLASVRLFSSAPCFSWGPKGSLFLPIKDHILIYSLHFITNQDSLKTHTVTLEPKIEQKNTQSRAGWDEDQHLSKTAYLNSALPMYHPVSMLYLLYTGNYQQARICLSYLLQNMSKPNTMIKQEDLCQIFSPMQFFQAEMEEMVKLSMVSHGNKLSWGSGLGHEFDNQGSSFHKSGFSDDYIAHSIRHVDGAIEDAESYLDKAAICLGLDEDERIILLTVADVLRKMDATSKAMEYHSLDSPGKRFWVSVQLSCSRQRRRDGRNVHITDINLNTSAMAWALQSDCKDTLLDTCLGDELSWPAMRALGIGFWLTDMAQLRARMEKLARAQYLSEKDPKHCALLYLALQRKNVLVGLFKLSRDEKDKVLYEFLTRDFQEENNQAAALKNAYVLMGKHRHNLAAAFFLLGGDVGSAVSVCAKNLGDLQLAFVICRLVDGMNGATEEKLIKDYALPNAHSTGDCWLASLLKCLLGERFQAIEELTGKLMVSEVSVVLDPETKANSFSLISPERSGLVISDPEVGHFCLLLATKSTMELGLSSCSVTAVRKWITLKTSIALEILGLPLQALEHLSSIPLPKEFRGDHDQSSSLKQLQVACMQDELKTQNFNLIIAGADIFVKRKMRLALQFQVQLVQAHPRWREARECLSSHNEALYDDVVVKANEEVIQSLHFIAERYSIDAECVLAELAKFVFIQDRLYLQCIFVKGNMDESRVGEQSITLKPSFSFLMDLLQNHSEQILQFTIYVYLACSPGLFRNLFMQVGNTSISSSTTADRKIMHFTSDLALLLFHNMDEIKDRMEMMLFLLLVIAICSWQQCHWSTLDFLTTVIKSDPPFSVLDVDFGYLLKVISNCTADDKISCMPVGLTDIEKTYILALSFWDAFLSWIKKQSSYGVFKNYQDKTVMGFSSASNEDSIFEDCKKVIASISSLLIRKLVLYVNSTGSICPGSLQRWLWGSQTSSGIISSEGSFQNSTPIMENENNTCHLSETLIGKIWKELVSHERIKSMLELGGARRLYFDSKISPSSNVKENNDTNITSGKEKGLEVDVQYKLVGGGMTHDFMEQSVSNHELKNGEEVLHSSGDLFEAVCANSCNPAQVVIASCKQGLIFLDINTRKVFSNTENSLWGQAEWPHNGWAKSESTPLPTFVSPGFGLANKEGRNLGLGGSVVGLGALTSIGKESSFKGAGVGISGYGGVGAVGLGWDDWEDFDGIVDPLATVQNVNTQAMNSHPFRPLFLVGSRNTHVYLWEFGKYSATATYGILPAANISPPYAVASISAVRFDHSGHRFATSAIDGTVCTWQLEVGGRSNVRPTESCQCFNRHASDVAFLGASSAIVAATGASENDFNLVLWDTLAPSATSQASVLCHEGGARCLEMFDHHVGGGSISPLIITCGKAGDIAVHDFRYIATGKGKHLRTTKHGNVSSNEQGSRKQQDGERNSNGMIWYLPKAHSGSITCVSAVPGTPLFLTGSKDGDVKLWDANKCELIIHWRKVHEKHMFLQHNARGFGAVVQAAVTDIHPVSSGFVTCGGDGILRLFQYKFPGK